MNALAWGLSLVTVSAATALAVKVVSEAPPPDDARVAALVSRVEALEDRLADVDRRASAALARADAPERAAAPRTRGLAASTTEEEIPPIEGAAAADARGRGEERAGEEEELDLERFAARLRAGGMSDEEIERAWRRIVKAGRIDEAIDLLEELAELHPNDPNVHAHLGSAYIQKLMTVPDLQRGVPAMQADAAFDAALKLDPQHWDARFSKAISLSFWPPIMGKQPEAIRQFETLIAQQESSGYSDPKHAQTYQYLGNLYLQSGNAAKAKAVFEKGLAAFPGNDALAQAMADL